MAIYKLERLLSAGRGKKIAVVEASVTGTGDIDTGLTNVDYAFSSVKDSGATLPTYTASITAISGGTVSVVVTEHAAAANAVATVAKTVEVIAIGD
jgi:hypothetical protein